MNRSIDIQNTTLSSSSSSSSSSNKNDISSKNNHYHDNIMTNQNEHKFTFVIPYRDSYEYVYISEKIRLLNTKLKHNEKIKHVQKYVSLKDRNQHSLMDVLQSYTKDYLKNIRHSNPKNPHNYAIQFQCHKKTKYMLEMILKSYHIKIYPICKQIMYNMTKNETLTI